MKKHLEGSTAHESKYARKRASGKMMYGPGCCAPTVSAEQVRKAREEAWRTGVSRSRTGYVINIEADFENWT